MRQYFYDIFCILPFLVCLFWCIILGTDSKRRRRSGRNLWQFSLACTILYFCHSLKFSSLVVNVPAWSQCLYITCNLAVYPLFYIYICSLTRLKGPSKLLPITLAPALLTGIISGVSVALGGGLSGIKSVASVIFALEVILAVLFGMIDIIRYRRTVANFYADTKERSLPMLMTLLTLFSVTALVSIVADFVGKEFFKGTILLAIPSCSFSTLLFCIFYWGYKCRFGAEDMASDIVVNAVADERNKIENPPRQDLLFSSICEVMVEKKLFLKPDLKITDLLPEVGSNRTYISNCINRNSGKSFSEFVHSYRIDYAVSLMQEGTHQLSEIAVLSGYLDGNAFYKAFSKIKGKSPSEWMKEQVRKRE